MKWCEPTLKPSDGQEIIVREKDNNGQWRYAIGVWSNEHRFMMPWSTCDQCGGRCKFTANNRAVFDGGMRKIIWQWVPLSKFLELERRLEHTEFEKDRMYARVLRAEEVMYEAVIKGNDNELIDYVNDGLSKL
jgi:hypothetical protein